jgi:hypothetical protein
MMTAEDVLTRLLQFELKIQAIRLSFVEGDAHQKIDKEFLMEILPVLNELSLKKDETSQKQLIAITALLWHYRNVEWDGLRNHLILFLSRAGFGPSSIMLDKEYSHSEHTYSFSTSIINQYAVSIAQARNDVYVAGQQFLLTDFQKELWEILDKGPLVGISAPTSAGKSFLILLKAIKLLMEKPGTIVYIVPTLSLVNQVMEDFRKMLDRFELNEYSLETTLNPSNYSSESVYILTQEKAIAAFSQNEIPFKDVRLLVVDEIQNVERVASHDEMRAKVLYDLMVEFRNTVNLDHVIVSGPRIIKIDELSESIFGIKAIKKETSSSPVLNLTYSINLKGKNYYFKVFSDLLPRPLEIRITEKDAIKGYGRSNYEENYLSYLNEFVRSLEDECVMIFSPTTLACRHISEYISRVTPEEDNKYLNNLADFIVDTVHRSYGLPSVIKKGIAYHHSRLPSHVRRVLEHAIKNGRIKVVIATTTLLQGVNLPVQNIIIRNPNLYLKKRKNSVRLSNYELANLRGRAGRLLKDFIGRTFIMDEGSFQDEENSQLDLFKDTEKELQVGYGKKYFEFKKDIKSDIRTGTGSTADNTEYSYITTYIRQTVMKHGIRSQVMLNRVGINLTDKELNEIISGLNVVTIDRNLCARNRYWDPIDLNRLQQMKLPVEFPTKPGAFNNASKLKAILLFLRQHFSIYYNRYFGVEPGEERDVLISMCILADQWANEKTLKEILSTPFYNNDKNTAKNIDTTIENLEKNISYGMALLLKPLYDIKAQDSMFPRFIEVGAYKPLTRRLIELNIPRETAIYLNGILREQQFEIKEELIAEIRRIRSRLPYWYRIQVENI